MCYLDSDLLSDWVETELNVDFAVEILDLTLTSSNFSSSLSSF
jgi:hypothetical protein